MENRGLEPLTSTLPVHTIPPERNRRSRLNPSVIRGLTDGFRFEHDGLGRLSPVFGDSPATNYEFDSFCVLEKRPSNLFAASLSAFLRT